MVTQKDIHNHLVENAEPWQKQYLSMKCGYNPEKIKKAEQSIANLANVIAETMRNPGMDYLNTKF